MRITLLAQRISDKLKLPPDQVQAVLTERDRILKAEETGRYLRPEPKPKWVTDNQGNRRQIP